MSALGIGSRKATSVLSWARMSGLYSRKESSLTSLGRLLVKRDERLARLATKWLVYYRLSSNSEATVWYTLVGHLFTLGLSFTARDALDRVTTILGRTSTKIASDVRTTLSTLVAPSGLGNLQIISCDEQKCYQVVRRRIPNRYIIAYTLYESRRSNGLRSPTLSFRDVATAVGSPGRIFLLQEEELRSILRKLESEGIVDVYRNAELDNVALTFQGSPLDLLEMCYDSEDE